MRRNGMYAASLLAALVTFGCAGQQPRAIEIPLAGVQPDESQGITVPPNWRLVEFGLLNAELPTSAVTVLADGQPVRMRATVVDVMPVPPQGRDTLQFLGRRLLFVWQDGHFLTDSTGGEHFVVGGTHLPALLRRDMPCCTPAQIREGRAAPFMELAVPQERIWQGKAGVVTIHPPELRATCDKALRNRLNRFGAMSAGCRRARFEVALDMSLRQTLEQRSGPVRHRAMAPVRVEGVQVLVDCLGPSQGAFDMLCAAIRDQ